MKYQDNIRELVQLQPDYLGFIFYEKSPRYFKGPCPDVPESIKKIGVFIDAAIDDVVAKVLQYGLNGVQLHGSESTTYCSALKKALQSNNTDKADTTQLIKVFSIKDRFDFTILKPYEPCVDYFLFDTKGKLPGGNGYAFNWKLLKEYPSEKPFFLSGGIGMEQLEAIKNISPKLPVHAIDVNSQFEREPGLKNSALIKEFINQLGQ